MKRRALLTLLLMAGVSSSITSCKNSDIEFPNYDYSAVYFAYQTPVRTIVLGEDIYDTSLDNEHKFEVYATLSGVYSNENTVKIDVETDDALCDNLLFEDGTPVKPLPANYYELTSNKITLDKTLSDGVVVELKDDFFADADAIKNTYVLPLRMTKVSGADSILMGTPKVDNPISSNSSDWEVLPKDYVLYAVKYINPWHATYLRRGEDSITANGSTATAIRHEDYVEYDEVVAMSTKSMTQTSYPLSVEVAQEDGSSVKKSCVLELTFDGNDITSITSETEGVTASGKGSFVKDGDKISWGNKDRDAIYLDYEVDFGDVQVATVDTLVVRNRGVVIETFSPTYNN